MPETKATLTLTAWRPLNKNTLRGFATVEFPFGLRIKDISIHRSGDRAWANLPAKPQIDPDGMPRRKPDGKLEYTSIMEWRSRELGERFNERVIALIEEEYPGACA